MFGHSNVDLEIAAFTTNGRLRSNAIITGFVTAKPRTTKDVVLSQLVVSFVGHVHVKVTYTTQTSDSNGHSRTHHHTAYSTDTIVSLSTPNLLPAGQVTIAAGAELRFDFSFRLPSGLPPSFTSTSARIEYAVAANGKTSKGSSVGQAKISLPLDSYDSTMPTVVRAEAQEIDTICCSSVFPCWLKSKGLIEVGLCFPDRVHFGQSAKLSALLRMPHFFANGGVLSKLKLELRVEFTRLRTALSHRDRDHVVLCSASQPGMESMRGPATGQEDGGANVEAKQQTENSTVVTAQPGTAQSPSVVSTLHSSVQGPYAPVDMNGLQHWFNMDFVLPMEPTLFTLQTEHLTQAGAVTFIVRYGARTMLRISQPITFAGYFEAAAYSAPVGLPRVQVMPLESLAYPPPQQPAVAPPQPAYAAYPPPEMQYSAPQMGYTPYPPPQAHHAGGKVPQPGNAPPQQMHQASSHVAQHSQPGFPPSQTVGNTLPVAIVQPSAPPQATYTSSAPLPSYASEMGKG